MRKLFKDIQRFIYLNRILSSHIKFVLTISKISNDDTFSLDVKQQILQNSVDISNQLLSLYESIQNNYKHELNINNKLRGDYMINKNNIDKIQFIFENCESATIPSENISNFNIHINDNNEIDNLTITIKDDNNITGCVYDKIRPFTRFHTYNDIASVGLLSNNQMKQYSVIWDSTFPNENSFQHNELVDAYTLNINIDTYKPRFPYIDIEKEGKLIHIDNKEMIKVYGDFVMVDKELFNDMLIKADEKALCKMIK